MNVKDEYHHALEKAKAIYLRKAEQIASSEYKIKKLLHKVSMKIQDLMHTPAVLNAKSQLEIFIRMLTAHVKGKYAGLSNRSIALLVLGLFYFALPLDMVPDFIPFVGYVDDLSVILGIYKSIQTDIERFLMWEQEEQTKLKL